MTVRARAFVGLMILGGLASIRETAGRPSQHWLHFLVYLAAILLSSGMKVAMPRSEGTMSVNFPFIFLGILQLSPLQAVALAAASVIAQSRIGVIKPFTLIQILFNLANVTVATILAWHVYLGLLRLHLEFAPALALAAVVYFFVNTIPVALIIAWESGTNPLEQWHQNYPWYLPFYIVGAMLAAAADRIGVAYGWMTSLLLIPMVYTVYRAYRAQMAIIRDRERHAAETEALHLRTIEALAMAIEAKDQNTHRHLMRVRVYVSELAKIMGLDQAIVQALLTAAFLHDIGKLAVPEHIINKPGKLTPEEFEKMKIHPVVGADILDRVRFPYPVVPIVRSHHEAWDGSGYPDGLKGEEIPIGARILTVVDCFDALASERPYRKAMPVHEAMALVKAKAGTQFDPQIVRLLEQHHPYLEEQARLRIGDIEPLNTNLLIERGAAPGAGFEAEHAGAARESSEALAAQLRYNSLSLIAEATQEAKALYEMSQAAAGSLSGRELGAMMSRRLQPFVPFDCFAVYLKSEESITPLYMDGACALAFSPQPIPLGEGLSGWVAYSERPIVNGNPTVEPNFLIESGLFTANSSALSIPLLDLSGVVFGVLTVYSCRHGAFSKVHLRILQAMQPKFSLCLQNALHLGAARPDPAFDQPAQLSNLRRFFQQVDTEIRRAGEEELHFGVVVCDLHSFRKVSDRHGKPAGAPLLRITAEALRDCCRPRDTVARIGEEEFVFLFPSMDVSSVHRPLDIVEQAIRRACDSLDVDAPVFPGIGAAFYPEDGENPEVLLETAERRMYLHSQAVGGLAPSRDPQPALESSPAS